MPSKPFKAILHGGKVDDDRFQAHRDVVEFYSPVSVGKLRDLYRDKLIREGVPAAKANAAAESVKGGLVFAAEAYDQLGFSDPPQGQSENAKRMAIAAASTKFHSGAPLADDPEVKKVAPSHPKNDWAQIQGRRKPVIDVDATVAAVEREKRKAGVGA